MASSSQPLNLEINIFRDSVIPEEDTEHFSFINNGATTATCVFIRTSPSLEASPLNLLALNFGQPLMKEVTDRRQPGGHLCPMHIKEMQIHPSFPSTYRFIHSRKTEDDQMIWDQISGFSRAMLMRNFAEVNSRQVPSRKEISGWRVSPIFLFLVISLSW